MVVGVVLAALTSHIAQAVLCDVDWFQGVWVQDWVQPKWIVRRGNPLHVCPRSQRPPVSQLNGFYRETTEAAMAHPKVQATEVGLEFVSRDASVNRAAASDRM
jgi:hypothetical protein